MKYNILDYFQLTTHNVANRKAIIEGDNFITFGELQSHSKILALKILNHTNLKNTPIAIFLPKSIQSVIANIAITYSSNIYMHLDIKNPKERVSNILNLIHPPIIITNNLHINQLIDFSNNHIIINIDEINFEIDIDETYLFKRNDNIIDTDPYCIINTSGSTGTPKGVVLNHKSFIDFL